jgi:hypothetical protein
LHCADNNDGGGNSLLVTWPNEAKYQYADIWNLHSVWDDYLVQRNIMTRPPAKRSYQEYAKWLVSTVSPGERDYATLKSATIESQLPEKVVAWAERSNALAKNSAYNLPKTTVKKSYRGFEKLNREGQAEDIVVLDETYFKASMADVERQLLLGGVRLARILNEIYDKDIQ